MKSFLSVLVFAAVMACAFVSCGEATGADGCSDAGGIICNNCSSAGDCDITCGAGQDEYCVGLQYFGGENPDDLRCAFCE
jgi:hypothetical protein